MQPAEAPRPEDVRTYDNQLVGLDEQDDILYFSLWITPDRFRRLFVETSNDINFVELVKLNVDDRVCAVYTDSMTARYMHGRTYCFYLDENKSGIVAVCLTKKRTQANVADTDFIKGSWKLFAARELQTLMKPPPPTVPT